MRDTTRKNVCSLLFLLISFTTTAPLWQDGPRGLTDPAGRHVEIPQRILRVLAAGRPASILLDTLAPEKMLGWVRAPYRSVATDPLWASVKAVQNKRIYLAPNLPYGWSDAPPGVNRLIGVRWLSSIRYPQQFPESLQATTRQFYKLFYQSI